MRLSLTFTLLLLAACGGGDSSPDLGVGDACAADSDCTAGAKCVYPIADGCAAKGVCAKQSGITCGSIVLLCGCDGSQVESGCAFPSGYASGPTNGASALACGDGGA